MAADCVFQLSMKAFHHAVGGWVETGSPGAAETRVNAQRLEEVGLELAPLVRSDAAGYAKSGDPTGEASFRDGLGGDFLQRPGFRPAGVAVNCSETVPVWARRRKRPDEVHVDVLETGGRRFKLAEWNGHMAGHFDLLASQASARPYAAVSLYVWPHVALSDEP